MILNKYFLSIIGFIAFILGSITCSAQSDFTPKWSKGVVWYQIFAERFF